jgi:hypothetical protein
MLKTLAGVLICGSSGVRSAMYYEVFSDTTTRELTPDGISPLQSVPKKAFGLDPTDHHLDHRHRELGVMVFLPATLMIGAL